MNERLSKHSWGWWLETPSCPLWRQTNDDNGPMPRQNCITGDPLHSRALAHSRAPLFTQPCPHCSHSRAPGEQWARLCVFTLQGCVQAARLCGGSPVCIASKCIMQEVPNSWGLFTDRDQWHWQWAWISNYIHSELCDVIIHPCPNFNGKKPKPPQNVGHGWVIAFHKTLWDVITYPSPNHT